MTLETEKLLLRPLEEKDFSALYAIFSDKETMAHYPAPFDEARVRGWITWNQDNYARYGFGLWGVVLKETGQLIGDCGITMQPIDGQMLPEIGYHIHKNYWGRGYAAQAAALCIRLAFERFDLPAVYSYMKYTNVASQRVAEKNGMTLIQEYPDPVNTFTRVYRLTRAAWQKQA